MSDGDAEPPEESEDAADAAASEEEYELDVETFEERLESAASELEAAETEDDLDDVAATLDAIETDLEAADLPEPEDEEEGEGEGPAERLESELADLRADLEAQRGPYTDDVVSGVESAKETISSEEWTERGEGEVVVALETFVESVNESLDASVTVPADVETGVLDDAIAAVETAALDPDADAETLEALVASVETVESDLDAAEAWDDLSVREKLQAEGYYDSLGGKFKDYPPEWSALKEWQKRGDAEMVLLLLDRMGDSDYIERHALDALRHMGSEESLEAMTERAAKRDIPAIEVIGKIGSEDGIDAIRDYTDSASNPELQKAAIKALGEIGSEEVTQDVANELDAENEGVRSQAARALGLIGDTRAIDPLAGVLADESEANNVRASAAWALVQIGTERALDAAAEYADERSFIIQEEARKAADALAEEDAQAA